MTGASPGVASSAPCAPPTPFYFGVFLVYIAPLVVAVMNLLTGKFVQQANLAQDSDHEQFIEESVRQVFNAMDDDESGFVSREEFKACEALAT